MACIFATSMPMERSEREVINLEEEDWNPGSGKRSNIFSSNAHQDEYRLRLVGSADIPIAMNNSGSANSQEKEERPGTADNPIALCNRADISRATEIDLDDPEVLAAIMDDDDDCNPPADVICRASGIDFDDPDVLAAIMTDDDCFIVDVESQVEAQVVESQVEAQFVELQVEAQVVDLSSSSDDEDDSGEADPIAEEQEEIVTTLSREDSLVFAEVMKAIKEGGELRKFKVDELKTYLRHHGLRMSGPKFELLTRIQEHQRIQDPGRAEEIYPRASFSINCQGDVCQGDVVLFLQTVHNMLFDYEMRCASGLALGKRWVAGKVVSESYGAGKQQHTFTIEVLWSQGTQPFYCMRPVKIKGRNLYRMVTMRQPWSNEAERQKVLDEKHDRGAAARAIRRAGLDSRHKSKGKSRADARVHPYESHRAPQQSSSAGTQTRSTFHQGSTSSTTTLPPLHHNYAFNAERMAGYVTFDSGRPPRGGSFSDTQDSERRVPRPAASNPPPPPLPKPTQVLESWSFQRHPPLPKPTQVRESWSFQREQDHRDKRAPPPKQQQRRMMNSQQNHSILCSNSRCEKAAALQCVTRLCGSCCYKTTAKGVCQRHR